MPRRDEPVDEIRAPTDGAARRRVSADRSPAGTRALRRLNVVAGDVEVTGTDQQHARRPVNLPVAADDLDARASPFLSDRITPRVLDRALARERRRAA